MRRGRAIQCLQVTEAWVPALTNFLSDLAGAGEEAFFHPHAFDENALAAIVRGARCDLYYVLVEGQRVLGYGMLRGWDAGYDIPSLGIAIHPLARSAGLGSLLMEHLEVSARLNGATSIMLHVERGNYLASEMYRRRGYALQKDASSAHRLVGTKKLGVGRG